MLPIPPPPDTQAVQTPSMHELLTRPRCTSQTHQLMVAPPSQLAAARCLQGDRAGGSGASSSYVSSLIQFELAGFYCSLDRRAAQQPRRAPRGRSGSMLYVRQADQRAHLTGGRQRAQHAGTARTDRAQQPPVIGWKPQRAMCWVAAAQEMPVCYLCRASQPQSHPQAGLASPDAIHSPPTPHPPAAPRARRRQ